MNSIVTTFFFLSVFFPAALRVQGASTATVAPAQVDPSVVEGADKYLKSVLAGDASAIAGMFREDAVLMPADCPLLRGRAAIDQYYRAMVQQSPQSYRVHFHSSGVTGFWRHGI